eukprot:2320837-Alexandrium_andersonii.AAC.1
MTSGRSAQSPTSQMPKDDRAELCCTTAGCTTPAQARQTATPHCKSRDQTNRNERLLAKKITLT